MLNLLQDLTSEKVLSQINYQFAKFIDNKQQQNHDYNEQQKNLAVLISALVSFHSLQGNSCLNLNSKSAKYPFGLKPTENNKRNYYAEIMQKIGNISPLEWQTALRDHIAFSLTPENIAPLLFQNERLYFYRYWQAENRIAYYLQQAVSFEQESANPLLDRKILDLYFTEPPQDPSGIDWQKVAAATALNKKFSIISGGPGTGKTTTVAKLIASLQRKQLEQNLPLLKIALAAPTGKAAARLSESIHASFSRLQIPTEFLTTAGTMTIHRLIGINPNSDTPRHHQQNPLHVDLLVVDEASMIDLFVMEKLCNALKPTTHLILLGDKDQLASVEAGNLMGELGELLTKGYSSQHSDYLTQATGYRIFSQQDNVPAICDSLCYLRYSHRFGEDTGIGKLAHAVKNKEAKQSWEILKENPLGDLTLVSYASINDFSEKRLWIEDSVNLVVNKAQELYREYLELAKQREKSVNQVSVKQIFEAFQKVRFLGALRVSELGVDRLNQHIAEKLQKAKLVQFKHSRENYLGKPILITENSPQNHVYSGDIGIILPDLDGKLRVYFDTPFDNDEGYLNLSLNRLPEYEPAYIMTVHKSQGSEFQHTLLVMPQMIAPVLTKELVYTAITRASRHFTLFSNENIWKEAVKEEVQRQSGLIEQLRQLQGS
ncbi:exodeoxyribonuclease V subunit alpha [Pasteurellaceae bacterium 15-036681]|nr:exodeoxyribonuclease V subunit alpha [Pasteurellaceae bacterium 15-036681]